jgi:glycerol uptake facilitator protein
VDERYLGEFMGTLVLILMGNGVVANVLLQKSKAQGAGWIVITAGWAFAVMSGVFTCLAVGGPDAHLNPAVTIGAAVNTGDWSRFLPYTVAQILGAMAGQTLVWLYFLPHWRETPDPDTKLACFSTGPAIRNLPSNLLSEIIGTMVLVIVATAISHKRVSLSGPAPALGPLLVGCLVWGIGLSLGGTTGYAINPARDFGPRVMHTILPIPKKADSDWGYAGVPILGPLIGGALAGLLTRALF